MMLLDLVCFDCIKEQVDKGIQDVPPNEPILTPFEPVNNSGIYKIICSKGHNATTVIDNIDFEILFEYAINAIADGYYREAVSSFTSAMERYFEFFIKVVLCSAKTDFSTIDAIWKYIATQSERQLGAYIVLYFQIFGIEPQLLLSKEVQFRNSVIHRGYLPTKDESISFGNSVLKVIEESLISLKNKFPKETIDTFDFYGYKRRAEEHLSKIESETKIEQNICFVNIMTTVDVKHGREIDFNDGRKGAIEDRIPNILERRKPRRLRLFNNLPPRT